MCTAGRELIACSEDGSIVYICFGEDEIGQLLPKMDKVRDLKRHGMHLLKPFCRMQPACVQLRSLTEPLLVLRNYSYLDN